MPPRQPGDPAPTVGAPNDIAPAGPKPRHELSADEDQNGYDWQAIADHPDFAALKRAKLRFIVPGTVFFLLYYMTLPVLVGFCPELMKTPVWGKVNWAYLFALSQFIMTWVICALYIRTARRWDRMNAELLALFPRR
jgi:uncharacterized membrane protein (DUF485 family)